ncbi:TonB-dependent receptor family protein [Lentiprolixibacter aurantiacus]|uniref:TonB-dependent receptor n=1 Tax=Lentiprolixibacter aurantiacus TaxID=2993939 RepID=A0AAE3SQG7_9FLAO|nr:TonB-dependent receptor [Lentiprolixibacter aurantiacus]MCX2720497.1 TonB-dependent receptor [Lentiprolixibacter aurantiacus]
MLRYSVLIIFSIVSFNLAAQSTRLITQRDSNLVKLDEVVLSANEILGSKFQAQNRTGAAYYISPKEIKKFDYTDINRVLRSVPGVTVYEEDGFGLRPNISLRGTSPERSAKITLMEDGVLIAPAPYSAPAAYYFPSVARMQAVEILKGSSQVQYGPFTTGGAINMLSLPIPEAFQASLSGGYGSFNSGRLHAKFGDRKERFGYAVEYLNFNSNGFKDLDRGGDTGFNKNDLVAKFRYNSRPDSKLPQSFMLKFQYSDEVSDETYLGLTDTDFNASPFRRYAGSQRDQMTNDHLQFMGTHTFRFNDFFSLSTTAYYNKFSRNWYKLDGVTINGQREGLSGILENPELFPDYFALINGSQDAAADALLVKANNRDYISTGIQTKFDYHWKGEETFHDIEIGLRYHYDEEDRFQWVDGYGITNGVMNLTTAGTPGTDANRISDARAFSSYALYKLKYNNLTLTPGLRFESIRLGRINYGTNDITREGTDLSERSNQVDVFIPGIGFNYNFEQFSLFGGVHKGFSPPTSREGEEAEESINLELGTRFTFLGLSGEIIGFFNDYSNLLGSDLAATGGTGSLEQFNAGAVNVSGLELLLNYNLLSNNEKFQLPVTFAYTFTDTEFQNSFGSEDDLWGEVTAGDELPYIAKHQFNLGISLEHQDFEINLSGRYNGAFRTEAGSGSIPDAEEVPSNFIVDLSGKYQFSKNLGLTMNVLNLTDEEYAVARVPAGLRPGLPFNASLGFILSY